MVNTWDGVGRKRLYQVMAVERGAAGICTRDALESKSSFPAFYPLQFHRYPTSIAALDFSADGKSLAIASSYTMEEGEKEYVAEMLGRKMWREVQIFLVQSFALTEAAPPPAPATHPTVTRRTPSTSAKSQTWRPSLNPSTRDAVIVCNKN